MGGLVILAGLLAGQAAQVTLTPVADTALWQREWWHNAGGSDLLPAGATSSDGDTTKARLLMRFDVASAVPMGAQIQSATLRLTILRAPSLPLEKPIGSSTFELRNMLVDWGEGDKTYTDPQKPMVTLSDATAGEATWFYRYFGDETRRWTAGGGDLNDADVAEAASGSFFVGSGPGGDYLVPLNAEGLNNLQNWVANPGQEFGWMLKSNSETTGTARIFGSREHADPNVRPLLTIVYSLPPVAPQITSVARTGSQVTVRFGAQAGVIYRPQHRLRVETGDWSDLAPLGPLGADGELFFVNDVGSDPQRYFRIVIP